MNRHSDQACQKILDAYFDDDEILFFRKLKLNLHLLFCSGCAQTLRRLELSDEILNSDFFPQASEGALEEKIMEQVLGNSTENSCEVSAEVFSGIEAEVPGGFSFRAWVITGFFMLVSLAVVFFGLDFTSVASVYGSSFLVPLGITIGTALTIYCAVFIGSHLKELTSHFKLH